MKEKGRITNMEKYELIKFTDDDLVLDVNISPQEQTVWLTQDQIAVLYNKSRSTITEHINNIFDEGELTKMTSVGISDGSTHRPAKLYNLDVVLAVGYRVKSQRGIVFRRWATNILKQCLLKGYVVDEDRTLVTNENYINLINKVDNINLRVEKLENEKICENNKIFFNGELFDAMSFIKKLLSKAYSSVILIDPYADARALDYIKNKRDNIKVYLCASSKANLSNYEINAFNQQYGNLVVIKNDTFHDRFIIIDDKELYHLGTSLNYVGNKTFAITKMEDGSIITLLKSKL